jgi:hypothetical protein
LWALTLSKKSCVLIYFFFYKQTVIIFIAIKNMQW